MSFRLAVDYLFLFIQYSTNNQLPESGDLANLAGATILLLGVYQYILYKTADNQEKKEDYKRKSLGLFVFFLILSYAVSIVESNSNIWVSQIGISVEGYLQRFAEEFTIPGQETVTQTRGETAYEEWISRIRTIGLGAYVLLFSGISLAIKFPVLLLEKLFS